MRKITKIILFLVPLKTKMPFNKTVVQMCHTDIATMSALHNHYLTGGRGAAVIYVKKTVKTNAFAIAPHPHSLQGGTPGFGADRLQWKLGRQGDYLSANWLRFTVSAVTASAALFAAKSAILRWCHNLGHNLIENAELTFSGVPGATFDEFYLDFFSAFSVPAGKRNAYDNMIGNLPELVNPIYNTTAAAAAQQLPAAILNVPLPLPYTRDLGVSLPTGALIYNEVLLEVSLRDWTELLVVSNTANVANAGAGISFGNTSRNATAADVVTAPSLGVDLWGTYAVVTSDERKLMGKVARDMIWEIIQETSVTSLNTGATNTIVYLRYSHAVKCLFFAIRNKTVSNDLSNYTTREPLAYVPTGSLLSAIEFPAPNAFDPIGVVTLKYEGSDRLSEMPVDYFSLIQPFYHAYSVPTVTGYHVYSYAVNFVDTNHTGSVDYGKLTNVNFEFDVSADLINAMAGATSTPFVNESGVASALPPGYIAQGLTTAIVNGVAGFGAKPQTFEALNASLAHSVLRVGGGAAGFPIF